MMVAAYLIADLLVFLTPRACNLCKYLTALCRVGLHIFNLFICKPARLQEHTVLNGYLAYVMKWTGCNYYSYLLRCKAVLRIFLRSLLCKYIGKFLYPLDMLTALKIPVFNNRA